MANIKENSHKQKGIACLLVCKLSPVGGAQGERE